MAFSSFLPSCAGQGKLPTVREFPTDGADVRSKWGVLLASNRLSVPILSAFPLHRDAGGIADLDPDRARTGSISAVDLLRDDTLGAKPASVGENDRAILGNVFVE
jgi:hypothetical protein